MQGSCSSFGTSCCKAIFGRSSASYPAGAVAFDRDRRHPICQRISVLPSTSGDRVQVLDTPFSTSVTVKASITTTKRAIQGNPILTNGARLGLPTATAVWLWKASGDVFRPRRGTQSWGGWWATHRGFHSLVAVQSEEQPGSDRTQVLHSERSQAKPFSSSRTC